jgi:pimeloyl-ACP methyl ester carboxylesterase
VNSKQKMFGRLLAAATEGLAAAQDLERRNPGLGAALRNVGNAAASAAVGSVERKFKQALMLPACRDDVELARMATVLADCAYCTTEAEICASLKSMGLELLHFSPQLKTAHREQGHSEPTPPQWLLARSVDPAAGSLNSTGAFYLVFRGTASTDDIVRDLIVSPVEHGSLRFHGGFIGGVAQNNGELRALLEAHLDGSDAHLHIIGHSLGGSLALCVPFVTPRLLPSSFTGALTLVAIGSPPVQHCGPRGRGEGEVLPNDVARARVLVLVNGADAVPRLLGSPIPTLSFLVTEAARRYIASQDQCKATPVAVASSASSAPPTHPSSSSSTSLSVPMSKEEQVKALVATLPEYAHVPQTEVLWLRRERAEVLSVPASERGAVLHLHEALSKTVIANHGTEDYLAALDAALMRAPAGSRSGLQRLQRSGSAPHAPPPPDESVPMGLPVPSESPVPMGLPVGGEEANVEISDGELSGRSSTRIGPPPPPPEGHKGVYLPRPG